MSRSDEVVEFIGSRLVLGFCCLVLAGVALVQRDQLRDQSAEQECRDDIDATLVVEMARSLQRIEAAEAARATGNWRAVVVTVDLSDKDSYELAINRRERAVSICGGG